MADTAGPKIGDARSLWNFTPSPGWTKDECATLRLCLMKFGIGRWMQIVESGVLPGKQIQQLNGQTQRLLGQQSLAEYTSMHVDVDRIREENNTKTGPEIYRKSGLITNTGGKLKKEAAQTLRAENKAKYGLSEAEIAAIVLPDPPSKKKLGADARLFLVPLLETAGDAFSLRSTFTESTLFLFFLAGGGGVIGELVAMGFDKEMAADAVAEVGNETMTCVEWLVANSA